MSERVGVIDGRPNFSTGPRTTVRGQQTTVRARGGERQDVQGKEKEENMQKADARDGRDDGDGGEDV